MAQPAGVSSRHEKSLGLLTSKFVSLLQEVKDGVLDLKVAADTLAVRQKRRIYDITNVLEGIGLIAKKSKNSVQWNGVGAGCNTQETQARLKNLRSEIGCLELKEKELDQQKARLQQSIANVMDDSENQRFSFVTHDDICNCFNGETILAVKAPSGTQLEVPIPEMGPNGQKKHQISLRSSYGPVNVLMIHKASSLSKPVAIPLPPPDDITQPQVKAEPSSPRNPSIQNIPQQTEENPHKDSEVSSTSDENSTIDRFCELPDSLLYPPLTTDSASSSASSRDFLPLDGNNILQSNTLDIAELGDIDDQMRGDLIDEFMSSDVFPLLRLSPTPGDDYSFHLDDSEGVCDLFDVQILNF